MSVVRAILASLCVLIIGAFAHGAELTASHRHVAHIHVYKHVVHPKMCLTGWWGVYYQNSYRPMWATRCYTTVAQSY
jgi:hypothetical protein